MQEPITCLFDVLKPLWTLLSVNEQLTLRSCCRAGRAAHDSLVECLNVHNLWGRTLPEDASELYRGIQGMCGRGMRPTSLMLRFQGPLSPAARSAYGLAVLRAVGPPAPDPMRAAAVQLALAGSDQGVLPQASGLELITHGTSSSSSSSPEAGSGSSSCSPASDRDASGQGGGGGGGGAAANGGGASIRKLRLEGVPLDCPAVLHALCAALPGLTALKLYGYELGSDSSSGSGGGSSSTGEGGSSSSGGGVAELLALLGPRLREVTFQDCRVPAAVAAPASAAAAPASAVAAHNGGPTADVAAGAQADWAQPLLAALRGCSSLRYLGLRSATACCPLLARVLLLQPQQPEPEQGTQTACGSAGDADLWAVLGRLTQLKLQSPLGPPSGSSLAAKPYPLHDGSVGGWLGDAPDQAAAARVAGLCYVLQRLSGLTRLQLGERMVEFTSLAPLLLPPPPQHHHHGGGSSGSGAQGQPPAAVKEEAPPAAVWRCSSSVRSSMGPPLQRLRELDVCSAAVSSGEELAALEALTALTRLSLSAITLAPPSLPLQLLQPAPLAQAAAAAAAGSGGPVVGSWDAAAAAAAAAAGWGANAAVTASLPVQVHPLPPRLVELAVAEPLSPWTLLALQPPPCLSVLRTTGFVLDVHDTDCGTVLQSPPAVAAAAAAGAAVAAEAAVAAQAAELPEWAERMLPASAAALAAALAALHGGRFAYRDLGIELHIGFNGPRRGRRRYLLPPSAPALAPLAGLLLPAHGSSSGDGASSSSAGGGGATFDGCDGNGDGGGGGGSGGGSCGGHGLWLSQLAGVSGGRLQGLELAGLVLTAEEVGLVVRSLPQLEDLRLDCRYPLPSLPLLACLRRLRRLLLNASFWDDDPELAGLELAGLVGGGGGGGAPQLEGRQAALLPVAAADAAAGGGGGGGGGGCGGGGGGGGVVGPTHISTCGMDALVAAVGAWMALDCLEAATRGPLTGLCAAAPACLQEVTLTSAGRTAAAHVAMRAARKVEREVERVLMGRLRVWVAP